MAESLYSLLYEDIDDSDCTDWCCPICKYRQYKYRGLECDICGFDATPYRKENKNG